jgi:lysophospholipase L1-like esterase
MPATAVSGLDLYAQDGGGRWRWLATGRPETLPEVQTTLVDDLDGAARAYRLYLPLYNGVEALEIGVPRGASLEPLPARRERPIVFYGTSITHGASASRPGMSHPAILGRRLSQPIVNLGFSGNGIMEPEVAALLAELEPSVYVVDCLPNMAAPLVAERTGPLVRTLRAAHPATPIVLVEDRNYTDGWLRASRRERNRTNHIAFRREHAALLDAGVQNLHYVPGDRLFGDDGEAAVDGSHPTDVGFMRMADALEPVLRALL